MSNKNQILALIDGSRLMIEALAQSGAEAFIGYPITPANWLYHYATQRFPTTLPATDEITTLQWMAGFSAAGKFPVTATSFPGFALMIESLNMAFMMELPMVIILVQRLGPSTGSATTGAQGDLLLLRGCISGGYPLPVFCPSNFEDCWSLSAKAISAAIKLRTPVVLLTSKEMVMTSRSFQLGRLEKPTHVSWRFYQSQSPYLPYASDNNHAPPFLPVGNSNHQVRLSASTHDASGLIKKTTPEAIANTRRLASKIKKGMDEYADFVMDEQAGARTLLVAYGITSEAARDATGHLRAKGHSISLLVLKTLLPVPGEVIDVMDRYEKIIFAEENLNGSLREIIYGQCQRQKIQSVNRIGHMVSPSEIAERIKNVN